MTAPPEIPAGLRQRKKLLTRQAIADVALRLFLERGFDAVTVAEVADAAGVSVKTIFNYFGSKEDLFFDLAPEIRESIVMAIAGRSPGTTITASLTRLLSDHRIPDGRGWHTLHDREGYAVFRRFLEVWQASPALRARQVRWDRGLEHDLRALIAAETADRAPREEALRTMAAMLTAALQLRHAAMMEWVLAGRPAAEVERDVRALVEESLGRVAQAFPDLDVPARPGIARASAAAS